MNLSSIFAVGLGILTFALASVGWWGHADVTSLPDTDDRISETLYRSLLAFSGDAIYLGNKTHDSFLLSCARFTGLAATITVISGLLAGLFRDRIDRYRASRRQGHHVLIGSTNFSLKRSQMIAAKENRLLTVLDTEARVAFMRKHSKDRSTIFITSTMDQENIRRHWGSAPARVTFGEKDTDTNIEHARILAEHIPPATRMEIRAEESAIARDLELVAPELARADIYSVGQIVARSFVSAVDVRETMEILGQERLHIAFVGMGRFGAALAEEIILGWSSLSSQKPVIHVIDVDIVSARCKLAMASPYLETIAELHFRQVDANSKGGAGEAALLLDANRVVPLTAIIVSTGNDARNLGIGLRLRQVQTYRMLLKARIFVRDQANTCMGPDSLEFINDGVSFFGGRLPRYHEANDQVDQEKLARKLHETWLDGEPEETRVSQAWSKLPHSKKLTNYRAAYSAVNVLRMANLCPPLSGGLVGLRAHHEAVRLVLDDSTVIKRLSKAEHTRWMNERIVEGWTQSQTGYRDNEKKQHLLLLPWSALLKEEKAKDQANIKQILIAAARRSGPKSLGRCWRMRLRVGVIGRLSEAGEALRDTTWSKLESALLDRGHDLEALSLEIVSPLAPGFDREGAVALMQGWHKATGRRARLLFLSGASLDALDTMAADNVAIDVAARQRADILDNARGGIRYVDMRPDGVSNTDILEDKVGSGVLFQSILDDVENRLSALSDVVVVATGGNTASRSAHFARRREEAGRPVIRVS